MSRLIHLMKKLDEIIKNIPIEELERRIKEDEEFQELIELIERDINKE